MERNICEADTIQAYAVGMRSIDERAGMPYWEMGGKNAGASNDCRRTMLYLENVGKYSFFRQQCPGFRGKVDGD